MPFLPKESQTAIRRAFAHSMLTTKIGAVFFGALVAIAISMAGMKLAAQTSGPTSLDSKAELESRKLKLQAMTVSEKRALVLKKERFEQLSDAEQQRIRHLHNQLQSHPERDTLNQVLAGYTIWLSTLPQKERATLADLEPKERLKEVERLASNRNDRRLARLGLTKDDSRSVFEWWRGTMESEKDDLVESIPDENAKRQVRELLQDRSRFRRMRGIVELTKAHGGLENVVGLVSHKGLLEQLSPDAMEQYFECETKEAKNELIAHWIVSLMRPPPIPKEKLQALMLQLSEKLQEEIEKLPPSEQFERLEQIYRERFWRRGNRGGDRGDRGRDNRRDEWRRRGPGPEGERPWDRGDGRQSRGGPDGERPRRQRDAGPPPRDSGPPFGPPDEGEQQ